MSTDSRWDVVVVGGGMGGVACGALLARAGLRVCVLERSGTPGGRARTDITQEGYRFNQGPHALYRHGRAWKVLEGLGIQPHGGVAPSRGWLLDGAGALHKLPGGAASMLATTALDAAGKAALTGALVRLSGAAATAGPTEDCHAFLQRFVAHDGARQVLAALVRVSTYAGDLERLHAGSAMVQLWHAVRHGVIYPHGGWVTLVDGLVNALQQAGGMLATGATVTGMHRADQGFTVQTKRNPGGMWAGQVVLAVPPRSACTLLEGMGARSAAWPDAAPVPAACLTLGLRRLPNPACNFVLGMAAPLYLSVHTVVAQLAADPRAAVVHLARYKTPGDEGRSPSSLRTELEGVMDISHTGWRAEVDCEQFLPHMMVAGALPMAAHGGVAGRPGVDAAAVPGVWLMGDWVGGRGMLADAALASAQAAAQGVVADARRVAA